MPDRTTLDGACMTNTPSSDTLPVGAIATPMETSRLIYVNLFGFAIGYYWSGLTSILLPQKILQFVSLSSKGTVLGVITAVGSVILIVLEPIAGVLSDRSQSRLGKRKPFMLAGTLGMGLFLILMLLSPRYWMFFASFLVLKVFWAFAEGTYPALMPDVVPESQRGKASGYLGLLSMSGAIAGVFIDGKLLAHPELLNRWFGLAPLLGAGIATFLVVVVCMIFIWFKIEEPILPAPPRSERNPILEAFELRPLFQQQAFLLLTTSRMLWYFGFNSIMAFLLFYVKDGLRRADYVNATSDLMAVLWITALPTVLTAGWFSDRIGRRKPFVYVSGLLMMTAVVGFIFLHSYPHIMAAMALWGFGGGIFFSVTWAMGTECFPELGSNARYLAIWISLSQGVPWLIGPPIAGILMDHWGFRVLFLFVMVCFLLGMASFYPVSETGWRSKTALTPAMYAK